MRSADRLALLGCLLVGFIVGIAQATGYVSDPYDARAYWEAALPHLYFTQWTGGYVYPPPMALGLGLFHFIGWPAFIIAFTTATWVAFWYVTRAFAPIVLLVSLAFVPLLGGQVVGYLFIGNVQFIMAAAVVASIRLSAAWTIVPLLTKVVGVQLVWFAVRREWRSLGLAVGVTGAVVAVTFVMAPGTWADFYTFITTNLDAPTLPMVPIPYPIRLIMAALLTAWGAKTNRPWTVAIAAGLAIPALYQLSYLPLWLGVIGIEWPLRVPQRARATFAAARAQARDRHTMPRRTTPSPSIFGTPPPDPQP